MPPRATLRKREKMFAAQKLQKEAEKAEEEKRQEFLKQKWIIFYEKLLIHSDKFNVQSIIQSMKKFDNELME
jgi:hypothetical protein